MQVESIVLSIISMLSSPNDESAANIEAAVSRKSHLLLFFVNDYCWISSLLVNSVKRESTMCLLNVSKYLETEIFKINVNYRCMILPSFSCLRESEFIYCNLDGNGATGTVVIQSPETQVTVAIRLVVFIIVFGSLLEPYLSCGSLFWLVCGSPISLNVFWLLS